MSKQTITISKCLPAVGKNSGKAYHKVNDKYYVWDKEMGRKFEDNVGMAFDVEIIEGDFPKITEVIGEMHPALPAKEEAPKENLTKTLDKESIKAQIIVLLGQI